jgi:hypothetical protein
MPKLSQSNSNIQKQKPRQRKNGTEKSAVKKKITEPVKQSWGQTLTPSELLSLLNLLEEKRKAREMSKMSETLARALERKQGRTHVDGSDVATTADTKSKKRTAPPTGKKPPTRSAGRGR